MDRRMKWSHAFGAKEAARFRPAIFLRGVDGWNLSQ
jgi:hypothetical protein